MSQSPASQHAAWTSGPAADNYFERNKSKLDADGAISRSTCLFASYIKSSDRVLEIGAANGRVLEQLRRLTGCDAYGTDPSAAAIQQGQSSYPNLHLNRGTADKLDYPASYFNVVIFGFCLYLVDRQLLMRVVAEADRVLSEENGRLMITDFDPPSAHRRPFKHQEGVWTYKMQYASLWQANPAYSLAEKISFAHAADSFQEDPDERVASWILVKNNAVAYRAPTS